MLTDPGIAAKGRAVTVCFFYAVRFCIILKACIVYITPTSLHCCRYFIHSSFRLNIQRLDPLSGTVDIKASLICRCIAKCPNGSSFKHVFSLLFLSRFFHYKRRPALWQVSCVYSLISYSCRCYCSLRSQQAFLLASSSFRSSPTSVIRYGSRTSSSSFSVMISCSRTSSRTDLPVFTAVFAMAADAL